MKAFSRWAVGGTIAVTVALAACGHGAQAEDATAAQAAVVGDAPEQNHLNLIREALSKVQLRPDQQALVDKLGQEAEARHASIKNARLALKSALADQVQAGNVNRGALKPQIDALLAAIEQSRPADRAALVRLHDVLDPQQRNQFVDAIEMRFHDRGAHRAGVERMHKWATDLNLTDAQRAQIRDKMRAKSQGDREQMKEQWQAAREQGKQALESFRKDQFSLDQNAPEFFGRDKVERGIDRMLDLAEAGVPVLTPEQRAIAAQKLRSGEGRF